MPASGDKSLVPGAGFEPATFSLQIGEKLGICDTL
jgi:hypothetical protein